MPRIRYTGRNFSADSLAVIASANDIIAELAAQGFDLTLRQLYYQLVARDLIPPRWHDPVRGPNNVRAYKNLGSVVNDARLAGLIDWSHISDRGRELHELSSWSDPGDIIAACADQFRVDRWEGQEHRVEVWIEKDALSGVFQGVCDELGVALFACKGYTSQSAMWEAGQRLLRHRDRGQSPVILHFGDHDPSGMDMTRDIQERLQLFTADDVCVERLALNMAQVVEYDPPPNPARTTDARSEAYIEQYGDESWELDALSPAVLAALVRGGVEQYLDRDLFEAREAEQAEGRRRLAALAKKERGLR